MWNVMLAVLVTLVAWYIGFIVGLDQGGSIGNLFAIVSMGSFILYALEKKEK